jgi:hypothetical protein
MDAQHQDDSLAPGDERLLELRLRLAALPPGKLRQFAQWAEADRKRSAALS